MRVRISVAIISASCSSASVYRLPCGARAFVRRIGAGQEGRHVGAVEPIVVAEDVSQFVQDDVPLMQRRGALLVEHDIDGRFGDPRAEGFAAQRHGTQDDRATATISKG
jgi:hypothetical protein